MFDQQTVAGGMQSEAHARNSEHDPHLNVLCNLIDLRNHSLYIFFLCLNITSL